MKRSQPKRNWDDARARHADQPCRVCGGTPVHLHHLVPREYDAAQTGGDAPEDIRWVDPLNIMPLCHHCHERFHQHRLDLLGYCTLEQQAHAVSVLGIVGAYKKLTGAKEVAA